MLGRCEYVNKSSPVVQMERERGRVCVRACVRWVLRKKKGKRPRNKFGGTMFAAVWSHAYEASIYGASVGAHHGFSVCVVVALPQPSCRQVVKKFHSSVGRGRLDHIDRYSKPCHRP